MATRTIRTRLEISGDKEYKEKLKLVNSELSAQKSALKAVSEKYKENQNTQEALTAKLKQLKEVQEAQVKVLNVAKEANQNAAKEVLKYNTLAEELEKKLQRAQVEQENVNQSTEEGAKRYDELGKEIEEYQSQIQDVAKKQQRAAECADEWSIKQNKARTALNNTSAKLTEYEKYLQEAESSTDKCASSIDNYGKKVRKAAECHEELDQKMDSSEAAVGSLSAALAASNIQKVSEEIKESLLECVDAAVQFETALAKVSTIADTSHVSMSTIKEDIIKLSNETGKSVSELSEATYNAISASVETAGAVGFVATATKLATGGFTDDATAVDILTTVLNAYDMELERTEEVANYLITTQNLGKTTVNELATTMGRVIPVAAAYNVEMSDLSTAMAVLTARGIATAESSTYLKATLNELGDSGSNVSKALREQVGMSFAELMKQGYSLGDVMDILGRSVDNDRGAFNELWGSQEAGIAALSLLAAGSKEYNEVLGKMKNSAGATESAYAKMADTTEMSQKKLSNACNNLKIVLGTELNDSLKGVYDSGTDILTFMANFIEENEWAVPVIEGLGGALGILATVIGGYTVATEVAIPVIKAFSAALAANPAGMVALAVGGLVAVLTPLVVEMRNAKDEIDLQTEAWKKEADALNETVDAYQAQKAETENAIKDNDALAESLAELIIKEDKTVADKKAIADITDKLNEKLPNLGLTYDELSDSINMTTEELDKLLEKLQLQERYETAKSNYATAYSDRMRVQQELAEAQDKLTEATERYNREAAEFIERGDPLTSELNDLHWEIVEYEESVEQLTESLEGADGALEEMSNDMNLYTIETSNMTEAQRESINAMLEIAETKRGNMEVYYAEIEAIAQIANAYNTSAETAQVAMESVAERWEELQTAYAESYDAAYQSISGQIGLFQEMEKSNSVSISTMIENLDGQLEYLNGYAENMQLAMELGVDKGILQALSDGSEESAAILEEIVGNGEEKIGELNEKFASVEEGKQRFSEVMAELEVSYQEDLNKLVEDTQKAVKAMAQYDKAYASAAETCRGIKMGIDANWSSVVNKYWQLGVAAMNAYREAQGIHSPSKEFEWSAEMSMLGIEGGVDKNKQDVLDKYRTLARDTIDVYSREMSEIQSRENKIGRMEWNSQRIMERYSETAAVGNGLSSQVSHNTNQTFNIYQPVKTPSEIMRAARLEAQYGMVGD